jgi:hypothetical protein
MTRLIGRRWRSFAGLLALVLVALAVGVSQVFAADTATAPIQKLNNSCGYDLGKKPIGSVTFTRIDKTTLRTAVRINSGEPSTTYTIYLYHDHVCSPVTKLGEFKTGSAGDGNATFSTSTYGYQNFYVGAWSAVGNANVSPTVEVKG